MVDERGPRRITKLQDFEKLFRKHVSTKALRYLIRRFGCDITIYRNVTEAEFSEENIVPADELIQAAINVYNEYSGFSPAKPNPKSTIPPPNVSFSARILISQIPTNPFDAASTGLLEKRVIYTFDDIVTNDVFKIFTSDHTTKVFIVGQLLVTGYTEPLYKSFEINNFGGEGR